MKDGLRREGRLAPHSLNSCSRETRSGSKSHSWRSLLKQRNRASRGTILGCNTYLNSSSSQKPSQHRQVTPQSRIRTWGWSIWKLGCTKIGDISVGSTFLPKPLEDWWAIRCREKSESSHFWAHRRVPYLPQGQRSKGRSYGPMLGQQCTGRASNQRQQGYLNGWQEFMPASSLGRSSHDRHAEPGELHIA